MVRGIKAELVNQRFGRLLVIEELPRLIKGTRKIVNWKCLCSCGKITTSTSGNLMSGHKASCGCIKSEMLHKKNKERNYDYMKKFRKGTKDIPSKYFSGLRHSAKKRSLEFSISIDFLQKLLDIQNHKCAITGVPLFISNSFAKCDKFTASVDRIDSSIGYIESNVQWVLATVNRVKWDLCEKTFFETCKLVYYGLRGKYEQADSINSN